LDVTAGFRPTRLAGLYLTLVVSIVACGSPTLPHWADDGVHVVAVYWILT